MSVRTKRPPTLAFGSYQVVERLRGPSLTERHRALGSDGRFVILHVVRPELARDFAFRSLFQVHAAKAKALAHPNIEKVVDFGEIDGRWYLAVEDVQGEDLATRLSAMRGQDDRLARSDVRAIVNDVAAALAYAHEQSVVHGDLRPGNVILGPSGSVLTGFAIARSLRIDASDRIAVGGFAPAYMSPEQSEGKPPDRRSDIYALGVLTYELLAGRPPYYAETPLAVLLAHGREPLPLPSAVDPSIRGPLERVLLRALAVDPSARQPDARSFISSLDDALAEDARRPVTGVDTVGASVTTAAAPTAPVRPTVALALGGAALLIAGAVVGGALRPLLLTSPAPTSAVASAVPAAIAVATRAVPPATPPFTPPPPPAVTPLTPTSITPPPPSALQPPGGIAPPFPSGRPIYDAKLDGSTDLEGIRVFAGGPSDAAIRMTRGAIEAEVVGPRGGAEAFFPVASRTSFAGEFTVTVPAESRAMLTWALRRDGDASYLLRLDAGAETLSLHYDDGVRLREALAPQFRIVGLRTGRPVQIAFLIKGPEITVYMDGGRVVMFVQDTRITRTTLPADIFVGDEGGTGIVRITSARLYAVP